VTTDSAAAGEATTPFSAEQVERQVTLRNGGRAPRYPNSLRVSGIEGEVVALFVVSEAGRVEPASVRFLRSDHVLFEAAVRDALDAMRFNAAETGGKRVRQLVQMPFVFTLTR
jgi:protein TonB